MERREGRFMMSVRPVPDSASCDQALSSLHSGARSWVATQLPARIALLERMLPRVLESAEAMVADAAAAKGYGPDSPWTAEDWSGGPWAVAQNINALLHVLRRLAEGKPVLAPGSVTRRGGRTWVDVFPASGWDRLLLSGYRASVRMLPDCGVAQARASAGRAYAGRDWRPGVALVLGAGNVAAITALDILHKLYAEGQVVVAKMNPVNAYLRPHFEHVFAELIERDWLRFVDGGVAEGAYLTAHLEVASIHVTGSARTHDAIVYGTDAGAEDRRREDRPLLDKPLTSELGGVSPCIVTPGPWSAADFRFQAEHIVTSKMNNSGHNCIASQILVLPAEWEGSDRLLAEIRTVLRSLPDRADYYPGARDRIGAVHAAHPDAERFGTASAPQRLLVDAVEPDSADRLLTDEVFASVLGVVRLPGASAPEFLANAVDFANHVLPGTLGATLLVHPRTERAHGPAVCSAIDELRYGTLGVNCWSGVGFLLGYTPWGAHPGHTRPDIGSGIGFVHNAFGLEGVEKTVVRAPFAPAPRGAFVGSLSLSPRPPYFVTNRTGAKTLRRLVSFTAAPNVFALPGIFASALRG
jgi:acyl-CoA reductase-like NAD-dependent aldehyde dehydrogenase